MKDNSELKAIRQQLKEILKEKKMSYRVLAKKMKVSEVTVKRFFTTPDISFIKLQQICGVVGISALELVSLVTRGNERTFHLTDAQELQLSQNERLYDFYVALLHARSLPKVLDMGRFDGANIPKFLRELKVLDLIELPIGDKVHVKNSGTLTWRKGGALQKKFMRKRHQKYLDVFESDLGNASNYLTSSQRQLRPESLAELKREMEYVMQKFRDRAYIEETTCADDKLVGVAWLVGLGKYDPLT